MAWVIFQKQVRSDPFASSTRNPEVLPADPLVALSMQVGIAG